MDRPDRAYRSILIGGTNGKGSVAAMAERALRAAGCRTGRYTSPHLAALEERFALDGEPVAPAVLDEALARVRDAAASLDSPPTYFEATTAAAFEIFRRSGVEVAVLEVGLGGRLDATNVVDAAAVAITAIDVDHTAQLGPRVEDIALEKAGIIRASGPVVLARNPEAVRAVVAAQCASVGARLVDAGADSRVDVTYAGGRATLSMATPRAAYGAMRLGLRGRHQIDNAVAAVRLVEEFAAAVNLAVGPEAVRTGLEMVEWPARLEVRTWRGHDVLLDAAHNPGGARALAAYVLETYARPLPLVVAIMRDKAIDDILEALAPAASHVVVTAPASPRAARPGDLAARLRALRPYLPVDVATDPADALARAASAGSPIVVAGSLYLAGEIRPLLS
jgi:dihydrofolate synthase/folylpolyglutamate synthase